MVNEDNIISEPEVTEEETEKEGGEVAAAPDHSEALTFDELFEQSLQEISTGKMVTGKSR